MSVSEWCDDCMRYHPLHTAVCGADTSLIESLQAENKLQAKRIDDQIDIFSLVMNVNAQLKEEVAHLEDERSRLGGCIHYQIGKETEDTFCERIAACDWCGTNIQEEIVTLRATAELVERQKDGAYSERNRLVAALSKLLPSWLERHPDEDTEWEDDWRWIVFIDPPSGQMCWHIHDSELPLFKHLAPSDAGEWDGHTTDEKYERLAALAALGEKT